jgi:enamine deaminase RidA (YjgF/YER057c/UK114 family)
MSKSFESSRTLELVGAFPHAKRAGDLLFLSGIGPDKPNPTRTTVEVTALPTPIVIELKVIAAVR